MIEFCRWSEKNKALAKEIEALNQKVATAQSSDLGAAMEDINGVVVLVASLQGDSKSVMQTLDTLRSKTADDSVFVLANVAGGKVGLVVAVIRR